MLAFPYTALHTSQWNVDQAAGLVFCSLETARALGVPRERMVFPLAVAESNHMRPMSERRAPQRCPGFALAGERALTRAQRRLEELAHVELYSCFPVAVRAQARELRLSETRPLSLTGGMTFGGGPLNNFVLQALVKMAAALRADPGSTGLLTAVSGILTKQGVSLWSTEPASGAFAYDDVSDETARALEAVPVVGAVDGAGAVTTYTVLYEGEAPSKAVLLCDLDDGRRALVASPDPALASLGTREELCGRRVRLRADGGVALA
jgi:acetyl-CoA C-acetyltransferase